MNSDKDTEYKETSFGEIPEDWNLITLNEVTKEIYRYPTYYNIEYVDKGIPEIRGGLLEDNGKIKEDFRYIEIETNKKFPRTILEEGDIVISVRGTMGKVGFITKNYEGANITANLMRISPNHNIIFPKWFKWFFLSSIFRKQLMRFSNSTTIKTIKSDRLKSIKLPLPKIAEQKKIAEILSTVDETIEKVDEVIEITEKLKKGLMQELLTKGIGHTEFKETYIGKIPEDWELVEIKNIGKVEDGDWVLKKYYTDDGVRLLQVSDIGKGAFLDNSNRFISSNSARELRCTFINQGKDILISRMPDPIGRACISPQLPYEYIVAVDVSILTPIENEWDGEFVVYLLNYELTLYRIGRVASGATRKRISRTNLEKIKVQKPPLPEQKKIAEILSTVDEKIDLEKRRKKKLERVKKRLMQDLLTGRKRVKI